MKHAGAWEWGVDGAEPGIIMLADPQVDGQAYFQEYYEGVAEDVGEVIATGESIDVPAGSFDGCIRTSDTSHLDPGADEELQRTVLRGPDAPQRVPGRMEVLGNHATTWRGATPERSTPRVGLVPQPTRGSDGAGAAPADAPSSSL